MHQHEPSENTPHHTTPKQIKQTELKQQFIIQHATWPHGHQSHCSNMYTDLLATQLHKKNPAPHLCRNSGSLRKTKIDQLGQIHEPYSKTNIVAVSAKIRLSKVSSSDITFADSSWETR